MHPTARPTMTEMFLRNGDPNNSVKMMLTNDRNPRPMNSGEPQGRGRGADLFEVGDAGTDKVLSYSHTIRGEMDGKRMGLVV